MPATEDIRQSRWWKEKVSPLIEGDADTRVFIIATSGRLDIAGHAVRTLRGAGFQPEIAEGLDDVEEELEFSMEFPNILAVVNSVGTAIEAIMLLARRRALEGQRPIPPLPKVAVIVEAQHLRGQFARVVKDVYRYSDSIHPAEHIAEDDLLSELMLRAVGMLTIARDRETYAQAISDNAGPNLSEPGRNPDRGLGLELGGLDLS